MTFPKDINPIKFVFAAVGAPLPQRTQREGHRFMQRLSSLLEIPVHRIDEGITRFKEMGAEFTSLFESRRDRMLHLPALLERALTGFVEEVGRTFGTVSSPDQDRAIEDWINAHLLIDESDFSELFLPILLRIHETMSFTPEEREMHRNLGDWCEELASRWPKEYENALTLMRPVVRESRKDEGLSLGRHPGLHRLAQIAHQQDRAFREEQDGQMLAAVTHAIDAWSQAYEGPVHDACSFIFLVAFPPKEGDGLQKLPRTKHGLNKTNIFDEAAKWCSRMGLEFPFFESIRAVRNAKSHCSVIIKDQTVIFEQVEGTVVELSLEDVLSCSQVDITTAHNFFTAAEVGRLGGLAQQGHYDAAWGRACQRIPNLHDLVSGPLDFSDEEED